ncbi:18373_t:CDS:2, partial [Racocetra fulgida]
MGLWRWGTSRKVKYESLQSTNLDEIFEVIHHTPPLSMIAEKNDVSENGAPKESSKNPARNSFSNFSVKSIETILQRNIIRQFGKTSRIRIEDDRLIVSKIGDYDGCYQIVSRYGYMDDVIHGEEFISKLVASIQFADKHLSEKIDLQELPVTYVFGHQIFSPKSGSPWWRRYLVKYYKFLVNNSRELYSSWYIPSENFI